jgi:hypothetical protein
MRLLKKPVAACQQGTATVAAPGSPKDQETDPATV